MNARSLTFRWLAILVLSVAGVSGLAAGELDLQSPLPVDPNIKMGVLPNGMHYWIRSHKTPPGKIAAWMHVGSGSTNEEENQRGLAHFLEHMAFNGSENFPPGSLIKYFESIGLRFGQHQNAFTTFDQTTYQISLPDVKPETLSKGLQFLADVAHRLLLPQDQLERERGVVLEEARARKGAGQRVFEKQFPILAPGARIAERLPIGKEEVIKSAARETAVNYYAKWYRPDDTVLFVVGDLDAAEMEKIVAQNFQDWKAAPDPAKNADPGIQTYTSLRAAVITDPELTETNIAFYRIEPLQPFKTIGDFRRRVIENIGNWIMNRRFATLVEKGTAPFQNASTSVFPFLNACQASLADSGGQPEQWEPMLKALVVELKRAREFGFLDQELDDARRETLASAEQAAKTEGTLDMRAFLSRMNGAVSQNQKPMAEAQRLELLRALLPGIKLDEVSAAFKTNFAPETGLWLVTMPEKEGLKPPTPEEILAAAAQAGGGKVEALAARQRPKSLLENPPLPGKVAERKEDPDLHILSVVLNNGVRVHLRQMDFKKDEVLVKINVGGGGIYEMPENHGISQAASLALRQPAVEAFSSTLIREIMTGKNVRVSGYAGEDAFTVEIKGSPQDIEEGFRLAYLLLTAGKVEEPALKKWKEETIQALEEMKKSPEAQLREHFQELLMNGDPRAKVLTPEQVSAFTLPEVQRWLDQVLRYGPIEASIVGDLDRDQALALAVEYLGSLPARPLAGKDLDPFRNLDLKSGAREETVSVDTITPRAVVLCGWRGANWKDVKERRGLELAARIMTSRLHKEIRQERSLTYSIGCFSDAARVYKNAGCFGVYFTADPAKAAEACQLTRQLVEQFAADGPTDEEMETVHKQIKNDLETGLKEPAYWTNVLSDLDYHGTRLSDVKEVLEKMSTYTKDDLLKALKKYIRGDNRIQVISAQKEAGAKKQDGQSQ